jgi:hypothetical protein
MQFRKDLIAISIISLLLLVPAIGLLVPMQFFVPELIGIDSPGAPPPPTIASFREKTFQHDFEGWLNSHFGARNFFVRFNNQILYSLFKCSHMNDDQICLGKDDHVFFMQCLQAHFFHNPPAVELMFGRAAAKLKTLQDLANDRGIGFVFVISPTKSVVEPEFVPSEAQRFVGPFERYEIMVRQLRAHGVHFVDGHQISLEATGEKSLRCFPAGGIHWTEVAAVNTLNAAIDELNKQTRRPLTKVIVSKLLEESPVAPETDGADLMNLLDLKYRYTATHGTFAPEQPEYAHKRTLLMEGGSFCHQFFELSSKTGVFSKIRHFYYCREEHLFPEMRIAKVDPGPLSFDKDLAPDDIIVEKNEGQGLDDCEKFADLILPKLQKTLAEKSQPTIY